MNLLNWDGNGTPEGLFPNDRRSRRESAVAARRPGRSPGGRGLLGYPERDVLASAGFAARGPGRGGSASGRGHSSRCWRLWDSADPTAIQTHYVEVFDLSRKHTLYLSYWTDGDTRRRGEVLAAFKQRYRRSGFLVDTPGELPDYLPLVLEYAARRPATGPRCCRTTGAASSCSGWPWSNAHPVRRRAGRRVQHPAGPFPADRKAVMAMAAAGRRRSPSAWSRTIRDCCRWEVRR